MKNHIPKYYSSLTELYEQNRKLVYIMAGDFTSNVDDKNDICSATWEKIAKNPQKYMVMDELHLRNVLRIIVKTTALDYLKIERKRENAEKEVYLSQAIDESGGHAFDNIENAVWNSEKKAELKLQYLREAVKKLKSEDKELLRLRFKEKLSAAKTAEMLEISEGNVRIRQMRILIKLKRDITELLQKEGQDEI